MANIRAEMASIVKEIKDKTPILEVVATQPLSKLRYSIAEASSYSGIYEPLV
jgi:hypothetical protein